MDRQQGVRECLVPLGASGRDEVVKRSAPLGDDGFTGVGDGVTGVAVAEVTATGDFKPFGYHSAEVQVDVHSRLDESLHVSAEERVGAFLPVREHRRVENARERD